MINPPNNVLNQEFFDFFTSKNYNVSWDFDNKYTWYEIIKNKKRIIQVQYKEELTLANFISDCKAQLNNQQSEVEADFWIACKSDKDYNKFLQNVTT